MRFSKTNIALTVFWIALIAAPCICSAQVLLIDFDKDPSGNDIPAGFALNDVYAAYGLTFSHSGATGGPCNGLFANSDHPSGFGSLPNTVSPCPEGSTSDFSEINFGYIKMASRNPLRGVCIEVRPNPGLAAAVIYAYDAGDNIVDIQTSTTGATETLCATGRRIHSAEFSGFSTSLVRFDNLVITGFGPFPLPYYLPAAANIDGFGGARWRTDLEVHNPNSSDVAFSIDNLIRNQVNSSPHSLSFNVPAGESKRFTDVLGSVFGFTGASTLRVTSTYGEIIVTARSYNDAVEGTYGQFIPGKTRSEATHPDQEARLTQLSQSTSAIDGYRTNIGVANVGNFTIAVDIDLYDSTGTKLGTISDSLLAFESIQIDKAFLPYISSDLTDAYAIVSSTTPEAVFLAFATPVDNQSGDGFYFPAVNW